MFGRLRAGTLLLLALAILLGILAILSQAPPALVESRTLTGMAPGDIQRIEIGNRHGQIRLERLAQGWWMSEPYRLPANAPRIDQLLEVLTTPTYQGFDSPPEELGQFGLKTPAAYIRLNQTKIELGGVHPYNHRRYLRIRDRLHLIQDRFPHLFLARAELFVSPRLLPAEARIRSIQTPDWSLSQATSGQWQLLPEARAISTDRMLAKLSRWSAAQALTLVPAATLESTRQLIVHLEEEPQPLVFNIRQSANGGIQLDRENGPGYRLPADSTLLDPP